MVRRWERPTRGRGLAAGGLALVAAGLWIGSLGGWTAAQRPIPPEAAGGPGLWISTGPLDDARRLLLVVDPQLKNAAVYHVDAAAGTLTLKSTRDISYDLLVGDFNAQAPKPADLKKMLEAAPGRR
jgi:hypothetical protein